MTTQKASAPGKVLITGEYAVLAGAPAISMAVDRRAVVRLQGATSGTSVLSVSGFLNGRWAFRGSTDGTIDWIDAPPEANTFALVECLWRRAGFDTERDWMISIDTSAFFDAHSGRKYGLGSSAAVSVAAGAVFGNDQTGDASFATAVHDDFQRGAGSGFDIATSSHGGVIRFSIGESTQCVPWPRGLKYRVLWSGRSSDTRLKLGGLQRDSIGAGLIAAATRSAEAWTSAGTPELLEVIAAYVRCLADFDLDRGLGIFEAGHRQLAERAEPRAGVVYKPCGAGGGDVGIVLSDEDTKLEEFLAEIGDSGFQPLDVAIDPVGLAVDGADRDDGDRSDD